MASSAQPPRVLLAPSCNHRSQIASLLLWLAAIMLVVVLRSSHHGVVAFPTAPQASFRVQPRHFVVGRWCRASSAFLLHQRYLGLHSSKLSDLSGTSLSSPKTASSSSSSQTPLPSANVGAAEEQHQPSTSTRVVPTTTTTTTPVWGGAGDYAGLMATFHPHNGQFIPIPEYYIPKSLLEWGQEPLCLEVLVSEGDNNDNTTVESHNSNNQEILDTRQIVTVLPSIGCAVDNLDTAMTTQKVIPLRSNVISDGPVIRVARLLDTSKPNLEMLEVAFPLLEKDENDHHRIRVILRFQQQQQQGLLHLVSPMDIVLERHVSTTSSHGTIAQGGGLDGATVSRMLGDRLRRLHDFPKQVATSWSLDVMDGGDEEVTTTYNVFPGNITLRCESTKIENNEAGSGKVLTVVEVGHVMQTGFCVVARIDLPSSAPTLDDLRVTTRVDRRSNH